MTFCSVEIPATTKVDDLGSAVVTPDLMVVIPDDRSVTVKVLSKLILLAPPIELSSLRTVTPEPTAVRPVKPDPSPKKFAVTTPTTLISLATSNVVPFVDMLLDQRHQ